MIIGRRFRGPPQSANGGYTCGLLASFIDGSAEITLRRPPPIGRRLLVERLDGGAVALRDGDSLVAEGAPSSVDIEVPDLVSFEEAEAAGKRSMALDSDSPYSTCFVCGSGRGAGDGLRIFAGPVTGRDIVAAPWVPDASLCAEDGTVRRELVWAALDCAGAYAVSPSTQQVVVLGRLAAKIEAPVERGGRCVVMGWPLGGEGRRLYAGTALCGQDGTLRAVARATWVKIDTR